jgi:hypothetical protein
MQYDVLVLACISFSFKSWLRQTGRRGRTVWQVNETFRFRPLF